MSGLPAVPRAEAAAASPAQWVEAYWTAFTAKDTAALEALFSPSATVMGAPVGQWIARTAGRMQVWTELAVRPRGDLTAQELPTGYSVRQAVAITYREGGRPWRLLSIYTWVLVRDGEHLRASMLTIGHEAERDLAIGDVRIATYAAPASPGARPETPQASFRADETICFVITGDVQGGHNFALALTRPDGQVSRTPMTYGVGPIDAPGPITPLSTCGRIRIAPAGRWTVSVEVDGHERGTATFAVQP